MERDIAETIRTSYIVNPTSYIFPFFGWHIFWLLKIKITTMDNLFFKIICAAIVMIIFASCHRPEKDNNMNDAYEQIPPGRGETQDEPYDSINKGVRANDESHIDGSASPRPAIDSNPK
jgi:hypothetical protein